MRVPINATGVYRYIRMSLDIFEQANLHLLGLYFDWTILMKHTGIRLVLDVA